MNEAELSPEEREERERLKAFMALSAEEKLRHLEELNHFLQKAMPPQSKVIWDKLKQKGF